MLTGAQLQQFERDGYLVIPDFFSPTDLKELNQASVHLLDAFDPTLHPKTKFTTRSDNQHTGDTYFLDSSDKVSYFLEEEAVNDKGELVYSDKARCINKIGHSLHECDSVFKKHSLNDRIRTLTRQMKFRDPILLQSMLIFKQPKIGGVVAPHQDSTFLYTDPCSALGFWFALEDVTLENGCLWFLPGSHKTFGEIKRRFVRNSAYFESDLRTTKSPMVKGEPALKFRYADKVPADPFSYYACKDEDWVPAPMKAGSLVLLHGSVVHKSEANRSEKSRWAYAFHVIEGEAEYSRENWLQMPQGKDFTHLNRSQ